MPPRDSQNGGDNDSAPSLQKPEVPRISVFDAFSDDGEEWQQDGDPTQELDEADILEEHDFVLVGDDGQPIPVLDEEPGPGTDAETDLPPAPPARAARLPRPTGDVASATERETESPPSRKPKAKAKAKGGGKAKSEGGGKAKSEGKAKAKAKAKPKAKPKGKAKAKGKTEARTKTKTKTKTRGKAAPRPRPAAEADSSDHFAVGMTLRSESRPQEAIEELTKALREGGRGVPCHTMLGLCHRDLGHASKAISCFKNALFQEDVTAQEAAELYYELARTHEREEEWEEALYYYRRVANVDASFKDTAIRIEKIQRLVAKLRG